MDSVKTPVLAAIRAESHANFKSRILLTFAVIDIILWASLIAVELPLSFSFCRQGTWCAISYLVTGIFGCVAFKIPSSQSKTVTTLLAVISVFYSVVLTTLLISNPEVQCRPEDGGRAGCSVIAQLLISVTAVLVNLVVVYASCYRRSTIQPLWSAHHASRLYPKLKSNVLLAAAIINFVIMGIYLILEIGSFGFDYGQGLGCGVVHLFSGICGCLSSKKPTRFMLTATLVLALFSMLSCIATTVVSVLCSVHPQFLLISQISISASSLIDNIVALIAVAVAVCSPASPIQALWTPAAMETKPFPAPKGATLLRSMVSSATFCSE